MAAVVAHRCVAGLQSRLSMSGEAVTCIPVEATGSSILNGTSVGGPAPHAAREGRHKQRYISTEEGSVRLVAGTIPVRVQGDGPAYVQVLLISSRTGKGFCFPKGGWEDDESVEEAAKRETVEEAGVRGKLEEPIIGLFPFSSGKPKPNDVSIHQGRCLAHMYVLHVEEVLEVWPEGERQRIWLPLTEAMVKCRHEWMQQALMTWVRRQGWESHMAAAAAAQQTQDSCHPCAVPGTNQCPVPATSNGPGPGTEGVLTAMQSACSHAHSAMADLCDAVSMVLEQHVPSRVAQPLA